MDKEKKEGFRTDRFVIALILIMLLFHYATNLQNQKIYMKTLNLLELSISSLNDHRAIENGY
ncbi:MAG: hypothetical protein BV457_00115 [Thermoplasmata archaeon M9B1D]|nr:MAG: hypothetical protein BV457_00115 [Thermoplasmata archaeon M9B1D]PNX52231.1 MAG: hypothetical protein BV456_00180 [Thermoplasmata archaeon M8B2D]